MILAMLLMLLVGCSKKDQLTVYVEEEDALYNSTVVKYIREYPEKNINVVYFRTYEEMNEQLREKIANGEGPDVMLFNSFHSDVDPYKLASGGKLTSIVQECMEPYLDGEDSFDNCYDALIQSVESYLSE